jgi:preprotein translocase subunit SecE
VNEYVKLAIWVAVIGAVFLYTWRKGHLARLTNFTRETREELRKCTWPTLEELRGSTVVVFVAMAMLATYTVSVDFVFSFIIRTML